MRTETDARHVVVYVNSSDQWHGHPLYTAVVHLCQELQIAGATVMRGAEGFGSHHRLHTARLLEISEDLPVRIDIVDVPERIEPLLARLDTMIGEGLITVSNVRAIRYSRDAGAK